MKQHKVTAKMFEQPLCPDAVMCDEDLFRLKQLAGITEEAWGCQGIVGGNLDNVPATTETGTVSPIGSNISINNEKRRQLIDQFQAKPGTDLWFLISFGVNNKNGTLSGKIKTYLDRHPEARPIGTDSSVF